MLGITDLQNGMILSTLSISSRVEEEHTLKITHGEQSGGRSQSRGSFRGRGRGRGKQTFKRPHINGANSIPHL